MAKDGTIHRFTKKLPVQNADRITMTVLLHNKKAHTDSDWVPPTKDAESDSEQEDKPQELSSDNSDSEDSLEEPSDKPMDDDDA